MKQLFKYTLVLATIISLGSCLKDKGFENGQYGIDVTKFGEIITLSAAKTTPTSIALDFVPTSQTVTMSGVTYEADQNTSKDIKVTLAVDPAALTAYNNANPSAQLTPLPTAWYSINTLVTIAAGGRVGNLQLTVPNATVLDVSTTYGVAVKIVSNDAGVPIASNLTTAIFQVSAKNKYDGNYQLRIKTVGWGAFNISDDLPGTWPSNPDGTSIFMITAGANSVDFFDEWGFGTFIQVCFGAPNNTVLTGFGATSPRFTFDPATDKLVSVINTTPDDGRGRTFRLNTAVTDSRYDPSAKKIYAAYILTQNGRPDCFIYDTLTFVSKRP